MMTDKRYIKKMLTIINTPENQKILVDIDNTVRSKYGRGFSVSQWFMAVARIEIENSKNLVKKSVKNL